MKRRRKSMSRSAGTVEIQSLESRQLLTGTVNLVINQRTHDVTLIGDAKSNAVQISVSGTEASIVGVSGTSLRIGRSVIAPDTPVSLPLDSIRDLTAILGAGNDSLAVLVEAETAMRNVTVLTGPGDDNVYFRNSGDGAVSISHMMTINTDGGNDSVMIEAGAAVSVGRDLTINTGAGNDGLVLVDTSKFSLDVSDAETLAQSLMNVQNDTDTAGNQLIRVGRSLRVNSGAGNDVMGLMGIEVGQDAVISTGGGKFDAAGISNMRVGRNATLTGGGNIAARNISVGRDLTLIGGASVDQVAVDNLAVGRNVHVNLGAGNDILAIGENVAIGRSAVLIGGGGRDQFLSAAPIAGARVISFEGSSADPEQILMDVLGRLFDEVLS